MVIFGSNTYKEVVLLHDEIMMQFDQLSRDHLFESSNAAIVKLDQLNQWPAFSHYVKEKVLANLLYARAWALEKDSYNDEKIFFRVKADYENAITLLNDFSPDKTLFSCLFSLADIVCRHKAVDNTEFIEDCIGRLKHGLDQAEKLDMVDDYLSLLSILSQCYCDRKRGDKYDNRKKSLEYLYTIHDFFKKTKQYKNLVESKIDIAKCHIKFTNTKDPDDLSVTLKFFEKAVKEIASIDHVDVDLTEFMGAYSLLVSIQGFRRRDSRSSQAALNMLACREFIDKYQHPEKWCMTTLDMISATLNSNLELGREVIKGDTANQLWQDIDEAMLIAENIKNANMLLFAYRVRRKLAYKIGCQHSIHTVSDLKRFSDQYTMYDGDTSTWLDLQMFLGECLFDARKQYNEEALHVYSNAVKSVDQTTLPAHCFDLNMRIADIYRIANQWPQANQYYADALAFYIQLKNRDNTHGFEVSDIETSDRMLLSAPIAASLVGGNIQAIRYLEEIYSSNLNQSFEMLVTIEHQVTREILYKKYLAYKRDEALIPHLDYLNAESGRINRKKFENTLSLLIKEHPEHQYRYFINDVQLFFENSPSWIMIPIVGYDRSRFLLIPPYAKASEFIFSDFYAFGYRDVMALLCDNGKGLFDIVEGYHKYSDKHILDAVQEKAKSIRAMFFSFLDHYIKDKTTNPIDRMVFVAYGPLAVLPYAMAYNENEDIYLAQQLAIEYVPNLYCLHTLRERLKFFKHSPSLSYLSHQDLSYAPLEGALIRSAIDQNSDCDMTMADLTLQNAISHCQSATHWHFSSHGEFKWGLMQETGIDFSVQYQLVIKETDTPLPDESDEHTIYVQKAYSGFLIRIFTSNNRYKDYDKISTELHSLLEAVVRQPNIPDELAHQLAQKIQEAVGHTRANMNINLILSLETELMLRLVVLASCEAGITDFVDNELSPRSLLTRFIEAGALGGIAALWRVPDHATALLFGRFYYYHIANNQAPSVALKNAQTWLCELTHKAMCEFIQTVPSEQRAAFEAGQALLVEYHHCSPDSRPFKNPYFWAGFIFIGQ